MHIQLNRRARSHFPLLGLIVLATSLLVLLVFIAPNPAVAQPPAQETEPVPDRLAIPELPEHPTTFEVGRSVYYYNCMPCHGDRGQGLTEEWRMAWVDDHQNCWGRGCHGGRIDDEGFPIPRSVPALYEPRGVLAHFDTAQKLAGYLAATHPPQRPGVLEDNEYWAVTVFLIQENGFTLPGAEGLVTLPDVSPLQAVILFSTACLLVALALIRQTR